MDANTRIPSNPGGVCVGVGEGVGDGEGAGESRGSTINLSV